MTAGPSCLERWAIVPPVVRIKIFGFMGSFWSYSQIWRMPMQSSGDLIRLFNLFSIDVFHSLDDFCQITKAA